MTCTDCWRNCHFMLPVANFGSLWPFCFSINLLAQSDVLRAKVYMKSVRKMVLGGVVRSSRIPPTYKKPWGPKKALFFDPFGSLSDNGPLPTSHATVAGIHVA